MSNKSIGKIFLRREKDIIYLLNVFVETKDGSIYFSMPLSDEQKRLGMSSVKTSYHPNGQTHLTSQITQLGKIADETKRQTTNGLGFKGDKVYSASMKNVPLSEIEDVVKVGQGASFNDINSISHSTLKIVEFEDIKWGSHIIDSKKYFHLSLNYFLVPKSLAAQGRGFFDNEYCMLSHPTLDIFIVVRIFDHWSSS